MENPLGTGPLTIWELKAAIDATKNGRRGGPSGMVIEQIKALPGRVLAELLSFFQRCYDSPTFPEQWAQAE
eukprot:8405011-Alexandrium_andersonii.AAC.1